MFGQMTPQCISVRQHMYYIVKKIIFLLIPEQCSNSTSKPISVSSYYSYQLFYLSHIMRKSVSYSLVR